MHNYFQGGFDLQDVDAANEMTDRLLSMLNQYLLSNQHLELNKSFQIYFKVLSVEHSKFKASAPKRKLTRRVFQKHVGNSKRNYNYPWAIDVPSTSFFANKCLLICTILALAQHDYFENSIQNKLFLYLLMIKSALKHKQEYASKLLTNEME